MAGNSSAIDNVGLHIIYGPAAGRRDEGDGILQSYVVMETINEIYMSNVKEIHFPTKNYYITKLHMYS